MPSQSVLSPRMRPPGRGISVLTAPAAASGRGRGGAEARAEAEAGVSPRCARRVCGARACPWPEVAEQHSVVAVSPLGGSQQRTARAFARARTDARCCGAQLVAALERGLLERDGDRRAAEGGQVEQLRAGGRHVVHLEGDVPVPRRRAWAGEACEVSGALRGARRARRGEARERRRGALVREEVRDECGVVHVGRGALADGRAEDGEPERREFESLRRPQAHELGGRELARRGLCGQARVRDWGHHLVEHARELACGPPRRIETRKNRMQRKKKRIQERKVWGGCMQQERGERCVRRGVRGAEGRPGRERRRREAARYGLGRRRRSGVRTVVSHADGDDGGVRAALAKLG